MSKEKLSIEERGRGPTIINVMSRRRMTKFKLKTHKALPITTNMRSMWKKTKYKVSPSSPT